MRVDLRKFDLVSRNGFTVSVENKKPGTGRPLVNRADENIRLLHGHDVRRLGTAPEFAGSDFCLLGKQVELKSYQKNIQRRLPG